MVFAPERKRFPVNWLIEFGIREGCENQMGNDAQVFDGKQIGIQISDEIRRSMRYNARITRTTSSAKERSSAFGLEHV